jgi:hypothetical protein
MNAVAQDNVSRRRGSVIGCRTGSPGPCQPHSTQQAQGEEPYQRCPSPEVFGVLVVERPRITFRVLGARIPLAAMRPAIALAVPVHGGALALEAEPVSDKTAAQHKEGRYAGHGARVRCLARTADRPCPEVGAAAA